ncbi:MAG: ABC transporter permease, partial [Candidatus Rokubacteria bacterium]|nr:ABC transporter permease [Candidatus Rokubacteria bacterium]
MAPEAASPAYPLTLGPGAPARAASLRRAWHVGRRRPAALAGALVVLLFAVLAIGAPWIASSDPLQGDWKQVRKAPTWTHPFGTDDLGRD